MTSGDGRSDAQGYLRWLEELGRGDRRSVGGKCANLGELIRAGHRVPPGFALTAAAFERFLDARGLRRPLEEATAGLAPADLDGVERASRAARELVLGAPLPDDVEEAIRAGYAQLASRPAGPAPAPPVAVRSSALEEDGDCFSLAGQHDSYLGVCGGESVALHVRLCWASLYTARALAYRAQMSAAGRAAAPISIGVAVQQMVDARAAGVMLTCSPLTGDRSIVAVNASAGVGDGVVSGEVTPDEYWVDKVSMTVLRRRLGAQEPCLSDAELLELVALGRRIEQHYGAPQDIEWAIDRGRPFPDGLMVLQSRPETAWSKRAAPTPAPRPAVSPTDYVLRTMLRGMRGQGPRR